MSIALRPFAVAAALAASSFTFTAAAATGGYSNFFVFGDSLSDSGNLALVLGTQPNGSVTGNTYIPSKPYEAGTFTNGPAWTQTFANLAGLSATPSLAGGNVFAYGGARTQQTSPEGIPALRQQVSQYLRGVGNDADEDALYVVAGGGNNARDTLFDLSAGAPALRTIRGDARSYARSVGRMVDRLQAAGAETIVVWNVPDIGLIPSVQALGDEAVGAARLVAESMNGALAQRLAGEQGVVLFDTFALFDQIVSNPSAFGFTNVADACGALASCDGYFFFDGIHPTTAAHTIFGEAVYASAIAAIPEPSTYLLFAAGLGGLVAWRRRQAARVRA
jgi:outer membrane lipase/esterase